MNKKKRVIAWSGGTVLMFLFVWQQLQSVRLGYALEHTRKQITLGQERVAYLRFEIERKLSPSELDRMARERLGMRPATPDSIIVLDTSSPINQPAYRWLLAARPTTTETILVAQ